MAAINSTSSPYSSTPGTATSSSMDLNSFDSLDGQSSLTGSPFTVYDEGLSTGSGAVPSPSRGSPFPSGYDGTVPDYGAAPYMAIPPEASIHNAIPSNVSSPSSSGNADEYGNAYIPTSVPSGMLPPPPSGHGSTAAGVIKMEYDEGDQGTRFSSQSVSGSSIGSRTEETDSQRPDMGFPQHLNSDLLHIQLQQHPHQQAMLTHHHHHSSPTQPPRSIPWETAANPAFPMYYQQSPVH